MTAPVAPRVLVTEDGVRLQAVVRQRDRARGAVVIVHGMSSTKDAEDVTDLAAAVHHAGYHVITFDSRGHGESEGLCTLGDREGLDVAAAVRTMREISPRQRVAVAGASMGGIAVLRYAASDPTLAIAVTISAPATWTVPRTAIGVLSVLMTRTQVGRRLAAARFGVRLHPEWSSAEPPVRLAQRMRVPLSIVHGSRDHFVRPAAARELYAAARDPKRLEIIEGMGHAFDPLAIPAILDALEWGFRLGI